MRERDARYWTTADLIAIQSAVTALTRVVLGNRILVFGGHPSITPMLLVAAKARGIDYGRWVQLYQSAFYEEDFPAENAEFRNTITTPALGDPQASQRLMRERILLDHAFFAAVFIGGMDGVEEEYEMFRSGAHYTRLFPVASTGGAARVLYERNGGDRRLANEMTYLTLFRDLLELPE